MKQGAITAGVSLLIMTVAAVLGTDVSIGSLYLPGNANITAENVLANEGVFRLGLISWLAILITDITSAWGLFIFVRPVNKDLSLLAAWFRIIYAVLMGAAILNLVYVHFLLGEGGSADSLAMQIYHLLSSFYAAWYFGLIIFGPHLLILGYLCFRSGYVPKYLGVLLILAGIGYILVHTLKLIIPDQTSVILILEYIFLLPMLSEVILGIWLLVKGHKVELN